MNALSALELRFLWGFAAFALVLTPLLLIGLWRMMNLLQKSIDVVLIEKEKRIEALTAYNEDLDFENENYRDSLLALDAMLDRVQNSLRPDERKALRFARKLNQVTRSEVAAVREKMKTFFDATAIADFGSSEVVIE